jgi:hypothetical protein
MLRRRAPSPAAVRARRSRQRLKAGRRVYRIELHEVRLRAALDRSRRLENADVEGALAEVIEDFVARWIGEAKKPCA